MTIFEFVLGLLSVVGSLAIAQLLSGVAALIRHRRRVKFSAVHALWMWTAFATAVGNWAAAWSYRDLEAWPAWSVLLKVMTVIFTFLTCYLVTPDTSPEDEIDLVEFHKREHVSYAGAFLAMAVAAQIGNIVFGALSMFDQWLRDALITTPAFVLLLLALLVKAKWAQVVSAIGMAMLATYFLIAASTIGTG